MCSVRTKWNYLGGTFGNRSGSGEVWFRRESLARKAKEIWRTRGV